MNPLCYDLLPEGSCDGKCLVYRGGHWYECVYLHIHGIKKPMYNKAQPWVFEQELNKGGK